MGGCLAITPGLTAWGGLKGKESGNGGEGGLANSAWTVGAKQSGQSRVAVLRGEWE